MEANEGKRVTIRFICRYEDGTVYDYTSKDMLEFIVEEGNSLPSLEKGVIGMHPGDSRVIQVSAAELEEYPFELGEASIDAGFPAGVAKSGTSDEFNMDDDEEDLLEPDDLHPASNESRVASGLDLFFDVEMLDIEEADVELASV